MNDILFSLTMLGILYIGCVLPDQRKERIVMKLLKTYQMELQAGIKDHDSQVKKVLEDISKDRTTKR